MELDFLTIKLLVRSFLLQEIYIYTYVRIRENNRIISSAVIPLIRRQRAPGKRRKEKKRKTRKNYSKNQAKEKIFKVERIGVSV